MIWYDRTTIGKVVVFFPLISTEELSIINNEWHSKQTGEHQKVLFSI
jgi:hypothetical protein